MTDDDSGTDEVFKRWAQTAIVLPTSASRDHGDLSAILARDSSDGPTPHRDATCSLGTPVIAYTR
jgi:hypothetical protein